MSKKEDQEIYYNELVEDRRDLKWLYKESNRLGLEIMKSHQITYRRAIPANYKIKAITKRVKELRNEKQIRFNRRT